MARPPPTAPAPPRADPPRWPPGRARAVGVPSPAIHLGDVGHSGHTDPDYTLRTYECTRPTSLSALYYTSSSMLHDATACQDAILYRLGADPAILRACATSQQVRAVLEGVHHSKPKPPSYTSDARWQAHMGGGLGHRMPLLETSLRFHTSQTPGSGGNLVAPFPGRRETSGAPGGSEGGHHTFREPSDRCSSPQPPRGHHDPMGGGRQSRSPPGG